MRLILTGTVAAFSIIKHLYMGLYAGTPERSGTTPVTKTGETETSSIRLRNAEADLAYISRHKAQEKRFYEQLPFCDVTDVFRFVNEHCRFLPAMKPLQPRYTKNEADADSLMAVIVAQGMNHGIQFMARTSDIPFHVLETTYEQYLRLASLLTANDCITDAIEGLPIFPLYSFVPETLYGAVDGQKFGVERPTVKARHSRKYFGRGKGSVAYTLLCNHIPINGYLIGINDYEATMSLISGTATPQR